MAKPKKLSEAEQIGMQLQERAKAGKKQAKPATEKAAKKSPRKKADTKAKPKSKKVDKAEGVVEIQHESGAVTIDRRKEVKIVAKDQPAIYVDPKTGRERRGGWYTAKTGIQIFFEDKSPEMKFIDKEVARRNKEGAKPKAARPHIIAEAVQLLMAEYEKKAARAAKKKKK